MTEYEFLNILKSNISNDIKETPSGWSSFNAVCCNHVNPAHRPDRLKRAGIRMASGGVIYHCFNCGFSSGWKQGLNLSRKMKDLMSWFGMDREEIQRIGYDIWSDNTRAEKTNKPLLKTNSISPLYFKDEDLPPNSIGLLDHYRLEPNNKDVIDKIKYIADRGQYALDRINDFYSTNNKSDTMNRRIIIPFYWEGSIVGYNARSIDPNNKVRYFGKIPPNFIFNTEVIKSNHEKVIVVEGPFDAFACNGIALLGNKCSASQEYWLNSLHKEIIVVPDKDGKESNLIKSALRNNWTISEPDWGLGLKDAADCANKFGQLYTVRSILARKGKENG